MRRPAALGLLVALGWLLAVPTAVADAPVQRGWWHGATALEALTDALQLPGLELPLGEVSTVDVPADGLLVQGGTAGPAAYSAVAFAVGDASITGPLRLEPSPLAVVVPGSPLLACPLDQPSFAPVQGGRRQDAPPYDCLGQVLATTEPDGTYLLDVTTLRRGDRVAVALLPGSPTARMVFDAPGDDALPLGPAPSAAPPTASVDGIGVAAPPAVGPTGPAFGALGDPPSAAPAAGPPVVATPAAATSSDDGIGRILLFGGIAAAGAALWWAAGQLGLLGRRPEAAVAP
jgi:hypothetical protein